ncbi:MAG TPA: hypothetical protein VJ249_02960 [Candidatus Bathyarchaeia archaeon]|nr:hypothetical protein [Candidatus Bathyarchaeia archaeon]
MRLARETKGQFIIIGAMLLSIMIVSVSTVIYGTVTYYRQERWEEYVTIVDSVKTASCNILQVGLANYAQTSNSTVLRDYFNQWIRDVRNAYPGFGVDVGYALANEARSAYGVSLKYSLGLNRTWNQPASYVASNATVSIDIASAGLTGYNFSSHVFLKMSIRDAIWYTKSSKRYVLIYVSVDKEGPEPVINLQASNFPSVKLSGANQSFTAKRYYSSTYNYFIYEIKISWDGPLVPSSAEVTLLDNRGIKTVSYTTTVLQDSS